MKSILDKFLGLEKSLIPNEFWDEISIFSNYYVSVSGGVDSTYVAYEFYKRGIPFTFIWENTLRSMVSAREILIQLFKVTNNEFVILYPLDPQNMITRKTKEKVKMIVQGKISYSKNSLPCCWYLKEKPLIHFCKSLSQSDLIISSIAGYEGMQRQLRLAQLRTWNTFLRYKKYEKVWFGYPLRDCTKRLYRNIMVNYLLDVFGLVGNTSCYTCPIVALFEDYIIKEDSKNVERVRKSKKVYGIS